MLGDMEQQELKIENKIENLCDNEDQNEWLDIIGSGGIKKKIITKGKEERPKSGDEVTLNVIGYLEDNTQVEEFHELSFTLGGGEVISGFNVVVALMCLSEEAEVFMESRFAYGKLGLKPRIPSDSNMLYKIELVDFKSEVSPEDFQIRARKEIGERKRDRGNFWFNREEYSQALLCYKNALDFLDDYSDPNNEATFDEVKEIIETRLKTLNNMAAAQLKLEAYEAALISLSPVLKCQPYNLKALYRKGKVLSKQKKFKEALHAFTMALEKNPESKLIQTEVAILREKLKHESDDEKSLYRKMLGLSKGSTQQKDRYPSLRGKHFRTIAITFFLLFAAGIAIRWFSKI